MKVLDLFSGIGGFALAGEAEGFETVAFCEIEDFPVKVLNKNWPNVPVYRDVRKLTKEQLDEDGITVDVICGGFPCQDLSTAGKQKGIDAERSGLWSECARLLGEIRPRYAIFENVTALLNGGGGDWFKRVLWDISKVGYDAEWHCIPASELGAHHHRDRIWIIAYPKHDGQPAKPQLRSNEKTSNQWGQEGQEVSRKPKRKGGPVDVPSIRGSECRGDRGQSETRENPEREKEVLAYPISKRQQGQGASRPALFAKAYREGKTINALSGGECDIWKTEPDVGRVANGIPDASHRIKGLGNAIVPQVAQQIFRAIKEAEHEYSN